MPDNPLTSLMNAALLRVSTPEKPKPKKKRRKRTTKPAGTGTLAQRKRSSAEHNRTRRVKEATNLAHITKAIVREGGTVADVGIILGCAEHGGEEWLAELKARGLSVAEFMEIAKTRSDIDLIRVAVKAASGYSWVDIEEDLEPAVDAGGKETGEFVVVKKRKKPKHQSADTTLLKFLLSSRLPEYFMERREIKIDKRVVEIKADAEAEIRSFASGLLKSLGEEVIEAEFVETER